MTANPEDQATFLYAELEAKLKISSEYAISSLDSVAMLVTICKFADPNTAERVEKEIREEVATLALGDGIGEDGKDGQEQMRQLSKLVSSSKWEHWVSCLVSNPMSLICIY